LFKWNGRSDQEPAVVPMAPPPASVPSSTSKVLPRFLAALASVPAPVLLDLGPVVGQNITFFGEQLACKIVIEDLHAEIEDHKRRGADDALPEAIERRLAREPASIDGIMCWDVFDFLERRTAQALAARLVALLRPGGALYGFFGATAAELRHYTRYTVETADTLRLRTTPATPAPRNVFVTRDINRMFDGLAVAESVLLKSGTRETLFRKP
jgi:hypothetical protein